MSFTRTGEWGRQIGCGTWTTGLDDEDIKRKILQ